MGLHGARRFAGKILVHPVKGADGAEPAGSGGFQKRHAALRKHLSGHIHAQRVDIPCKRAADPLVAVGIAAEEMVVNRKLPLHTLEKEEGT